MFNAAVSTVDDEKPKMRGEKRKIRRP